MLMMAIIGTSTKRLTYDHQAGIVTMLLLSFSTVVHGTVYYDNSNRGNGTTYSPSYRKPSQLHYGSWHPEDNGMLRDRYQNPPVRYPPRNDEIAELKKRLMKFKNQVKILKKQFEDSQKELKTYKELFEEAASRSAQFATKLKNAQAVALMAKNEKMDVMLEAGTKLANMQSENETLRKRNSELEISMKSIQKTYEKKAIAREKIMRRMEGNENVVLLKLYSRGTMDTWNMENIKMLRDLNKGRKGKRRKISFKCWTFAYNRKKSRSAYDAAEWWYKWNYHLSSDGDHDALRRSFLAILRINQIGNKISHESARGGFPQLDHTKGVTGVEAGILPNDSDYLRVALKELRKQYQIIKDDAPEESTGRTQTHGINKHLREHFIARVPVLMLDLENKTLSNLDEIVDSAIEKEIIEKIYYGMPELCSKCDNVKFNGEQCPDCDGWEPNTDDEHSTEGNSI